MKRVVVYIFIFLVFPILTKGQNIDDVFGSIHQCVIIGDYKGSQRICSQFLDKNGYRTEPSMTMVRAYLAFSNIMLGYKDDGLKLLQQAEKDMDGILDSESIEYAQWLNVLASIYKSVDYNKSLTLLQKEIDIYDDLEQYENQGYINALIQICQVYNNLKINASTAVDNILSRLMPLAKEVCGENSIEYGVALLTGIKNAENKGDSKTPIILSDEFFKVANSYFKNNPYIQSFVYNSRLRAFLALSQNEQALYEAIQYSALVKNDCLSRYKYMTNDERIATMDYVQNWYFDGLSRLAIYNPQKESASLSFDGLLFAKGLMQSLEFVEEGKKNINSLSIGWKQVRDALAPGEAAVEFVAYNNPNSIFPTYYYGALVLKRSYDSPHIVKMKSITFMDNESENIERQCLDIWEPLLSELDGVKKLYFSPFGHIHNLPIECFLPEQLKAVNVLRLSSTRQLVAKRENIGRSAAVFGGLEYNLSIEDMLEASKFRGAISDIPYLKGTLEETRNISTIMRSSNIEVATFTGRIGTESSFKALSGKGKRIIHLATHGFYYNKSKKEDVDFLEITLNQNGHSLEDKPLTRSGLYMAGANDTYNDRVIPQEINDGILTAQEIANTDLSGLDLCVLSACQTAQGDISGEGVFGLQRGFKKAGAKSILMSLWKVDDEATCLLMTEFYKNWITQKMTKHDALETAKQVVRSHKEKGWDAPKYWAAFILLDGLD